MKITFLGTSAMVPTKTRNHPGLLINQNRENILLDCGENIQRQLTSIGFSPAKITKLLITHWHGDHILGIPGLIQSMAANQYAGTLEIMGPKGSKNFIKRMISSFILKNKIKYKVKEITGKVFENEDLIIESYTMRHSAPCLAYSIKEKPRRRINLKYIEKFGLKKHPILGQLQKGKDITYRGKRIQAKNATYLIPGKKLTYITDTTLNKNCFAAAKDADILICEATYTSELKDKAKERMHLTASESAEIAKKAKVKTLILTHFSQRYKTTEEIEKEAKRIFKNTKIAEDFMSVTL